MKIGAPFAYVADATSAFYASAKVDRAGTLFGPVFPLILGVYDRRCESSLQILRQRIFTNTHPDPFTSALVKVAAKRISFAHPATDLAKNAVDVSSTSLTDPSSVRIRDLRGQCVTSDEALSLCATLASAIPKAEHRYRSARPVAALLVDHQHRILGAAVNTNSQNRVRHAEVNLVANLLSEGMRAFPPQATLYTNLSPCIMCAQLISKFSSDGAAINVISSAFDSGRFGRHNALKNQRIQYITKIDAGPNFLSAFSESHWCF